VVQAITFAMSYLMLGMLHFFWVWMNTTALLIGYWLQCGKRNKVQEVAVGPTFA
jgi:hypothetical protein